MIRDDKPGVPDGAWCVLRCRTKTVQRVCEADAEQYRHVRGALYTGKHIGATRTGGRLQGAVGYRLRREPHRAEGRQRRGKSAILKKGRRQSVAAAPKTSLLSCCPGDGVSIWSPRH